MTHWLRSAMRRIKERSAQSASATVRGGSSRKQSGVSTVEYALILVAVVAIVGGGMAFLGDEFTTLFGDLGANMDTQQGELDDPLAPAPSP